MNRFPTPYAGTYYPLYAWTEPTKQMPFDKVGVLFIAFAHAYPVGSKGDGTTGATLQLEHNQPDQEARLETLIKIARDVNKDIKILLSLGWNLNDWTYISGDCTLKQPQFPASVVELIKKYGLDGFDIDDENIGEGGTSGDISPSDFALVVSSIQSKLNENQYLSITPAANAVYMPITPENMNSFDLINCQNYGAYDRGLVPLGYNGLIAYGVLASIGFAGGLPAGYGGIFNWTLPDDAASGYATTNNIAKAVGYPPTTGKT